MAEGRPRLVSTGPGGPPEPDPASAPPRGQPSSPAPARRRPWWMLLGLVLLLGLLVQTQRAAQLSNRVEALSGELAEARTALAAYQDRFDEVRTAVSDLRRRLTALDTLVRGDPAARPAPEPAGQPPAAPTP